MSNVEVIVRAFSFNIQHSLFIIHHSFTLLPTRLQQGQDFGYVLDQVRMRVRA
jgi:hypothetical protein